MRLRVRLLDDGYQGWLEPDALLGRAVECSQPQPQLRQRCSIVQRMEQVLSFAQAAQRVANTYLWGGGLGPNYDCSGLMQRAYASAGIWIPRDAYLQERFCQPVAVHPGQVQLLEPGDLIFFGTPQRCSHVGAAPRWRPLFTQLRRRPRPQRHLPRQPGAPKSRPGGAPLPTGTAGSEAGNAQP